MRSSTVDAKKARARGAAAWGEVAKAAEAAEGAAWAGLAAEADVRSPDADTAGDAAASMRRCMRYTMS